MIFQSTPEGGAMSVERFCERHDLSRAMFYKILKAGKGPRIMKVGGRTLISAEAASDWRRLMEQGA